MRKRQVEYHAQEYEQALSCSCEPYSSQLGPRDLLTAIILSSWTSLLFTCLSCNLYVCVLLSHALSLSLYPIIYWL